MKRHVPICIAPHEGPSGASREGPLDAVVGPQTHGGNDGNLG